MSLIIEVELQYYTVRAIQRARTLGQDVSYTTRTDASRAVIHAVNNIPYLSAPKGDGIQVFINNILGGQIFVTLAHKSTVKDLKLEIEKITNLRQETQRLSFEDQSLEDGKMLNSYGIKTGSKIHFDPPIVKS